MRILTFLLAFAATGALSRRIPGQGTFERHPFPEFDCTGKPDGNYLHPFDCTRFASCSGGISSERECAACHVHPVTCPEGRLVYDLNLDACVYADQTVCHTTNTTTTTEWTSSTPTAPPSTPTAAPSTPTTSPSTPTAAPSTTTAAPSTPTSPPSTPTAAPSTPTAAPSTPPPTTTEGWTPTPSPIIELPPIGSPCDESNCNRTGYCQEYRSCKNDTWQKETCFGDAIWNPEGPGWAIHGGNCDDFENLPGWMKIRLQNDPECLGCYWKQSAECSAMYYYQPPGLGYPAQQTLNCTTGFVFDESKKSCQLCNFVSKADGGKCC